jgi:hypothetical protein
MKETIAFLIFSLFSVLLSAQDPATAAAHRLANTRIFAFGGISYAGKISDGEKDFRILFSQPHDVALKAFESLYANGNPQARSYALAAIHLLAPDRFLDLKRSLNGSTVKVITESGCIIEERLLQSIAEEIAKGDYDIMVKQHRM